MHVAVYGFLSLIIGGLTAGLVGISAFSLLHMFGHRSVQTMGVWTIPNALVVDLFFVIYIISFTVWPILSSGFILAYRTGKISPFSAPASSVGLSFPFLHTPMISIRDSKYNFSLKGFQLMAYKAFLIGSGLFTFVVMPTCTFATVQREKRIGRLHKHPQQCSDFFVTVDDETEYSLDDWGGPKVFESLCWTNDFTYLFVTIWSVSVGLILALFCVVTAAIQYGNRHVEDE